MSHYDANMGGTNIHDPLQYALNFKNNSKYEKRIFMLTDGAVSNADTVINLTRQNVHKARVHTFGVGAGSSRYLVKEVARAGRGSYSFVSEDDNLKAKVISALKKAIEPSLHGCQIKWSSKSLF